MQLLSLDPKSIIVPERMRKDYGDLDELAQSIKDNGQIHPILVTSQDGKYVLVAGGRRRAACEKAGLMIDATLRENCSPVELKELELRENLDRKDMTWTERVSGLAELDALKKKQFGQAKPGSHGAGWSLKDTAELTGEIPSTIHEAVKMADAIKVFPELAASKSQNEAKKKLKKMVEKLAIAELADRTRADMAAGSHSALAEENFIVGDAFEGLHRLQAESVDFINLDTPYGIDLTENKKIQSGVRTDEDYKEWSRADYLRGEISLSGELEWKGYAADAIREAYRILKPNTWMVFWYGQEWYSEVRSALESAGFKVDKIPAAWYGGAGAAQTMAPEVNLARCYEQFFVCRKGDPILVKRGRPNVFVYDKVPAQKKWHPTQKPLELMVDVYETFCLPGQQACSPFIGSGNDGRAAYKYGLKWFGFDLNQDCKNHFLLAVEQDVVEGLYGK